MFLLSNFVGAEVTSMGTGLISILLSVAYVKLVGVKTPDEFRKAVQDAKKESVSCIIDAKVLPKTMAEGYESWWHIGVASTSKSDEVKAARKRIDDHLAEARMY